jgi:hypothetical protein
VHADAHDLVSLGGLRYRDGSGRDGARTNNRAGSEEKRGGRLPSGCPAGAWNRDRAVVVDGGWYLLLGIFAGRAKKLIARPRYRRILERATGTVLIALGVRMAVSKL